MIDAASIEEIETRWHKGHQWLPDQHEWSCVQDIQTMMVLTAEAGIEALRLRTALRDLLHATDGHTVNSALYQEIRARCSELVRG